MTSLQVRVPATADPLLLADHPWAEGAWSPLFPGRAALMRELALLERLFRPDWRRATFGLKSPKHQLRGGTCQRE